MADARVVRTITLAIVASITVIAGCTPEYPGEAVGTYQVRGHLQENECGSGAVPALAEIEFPIEIRNDRGEALYRRPDAQTVSGRINSDGDYTFQKSARLIVDAETANGHVSCALIQIDELVLSVLATPEPLDGGTAAEGGPANDADGEADGAVDDDAVDDDGSDEPDLQGRHVIEFIAEDQVACQPVMSAFGGPFVVLPCEVEYGLTGTLRDPF